MLAGLAELTSQEVSALSCVFGLLSDPTRIRLLLLLCAGERNVTELCRLLRQPQPTISHHLSLLRRGGMLVTRRAGKSVYYALDGHVQYAADPCELRIANAPGVKLLIGR